MTRILAYAIIPKVLTVFQKHRKIFMILVGSILFLAAYYGGLRLIGHHRLLEHNVFDQHTLQAQALLKGRLDLGENPSWLEIAEYQGKYYDSFPPSPTLIEIPLTLLFGRDTPNNLVLMIFVILSIWVQFFLLRRARLSYFLSFIIPLSFAFGSNLFVSTVFGGIWPQGQVLGYCFAIFAFALVYQNSFRGMRGPGLAYLFLALAVGCRPFYAFLFPLLALIDWKTSRPDWRRVSISFLIFGSPYLLLMALFNFLRFDNPIEFGHKYLPYFGGGARAEFSPQYLKQNLEFSFFNLPHFHENGYFLNFHWRGTGFWLNNPIFVICLVGLFVFELPQWFRNSTIISLLVVWGALLHHETNGWAQFGYRYLIDLMPLGFMVLLLGLPHSTFLEKIKSAPAKKIFLISSLSLLAFSIVLNYYGLWWLVDSMAKN